MSIYGEITSDYLEIFCSECKERTKNEYLGYDPSVPYFKVTCKKCGMQTTIKFNDLYWKGLPIKPQNFE